MTMGTRMAAPYDELSERDSDGAPLTARGESRRKAHLADETRNGAGWTRFPDTWRSDVAWGL